jgi:hypothetical protein
VALPIHGYLAYAVRGRRDALARALGALAGCEVTPATNYDVLVLVTDTPHEAAEQTLQATLGGLPDLASLTLVAGAEDQDAGGDLRGAEP